MPFLFSSQTFILRETVLENHIKGTSLAPGPYLDGKNLNLKLKLHAIKIDDFWKALEAVSIVCFTEEPK